MYVAVVPPTGMVIDSLGAVVLQVVTKLVGGAEVGGPTDMVTVSVPDKEPSETLRLNVNVAGPVGAVNVGNDTAEFERVTESPSVWVHKYVMMSPSGSDESEPSNVTVSPDDTVWFAPASAVGARLPSTVIETVLPSPNSCVPLASTLIV